MEKQHRNVLVLSGCQATLQTSGVTMIAVTGLAGYALAADKSFATLPLTRYSAGLRGGRTLVDAPLRHHEPHDGLDAARHACARSSLQRCGVRLRECLQFNLDRLNQAENMLKRSIAPNYPLDTAQLNYWLIQSYSLLDPDLLGAEDGT